MDTLQNSPSRRLLHIRLQKVHNWQPPMMYRDNTLKSCGRLYEHASQVLHPVEAAYGLGSRHAIIVRKLKSGVDVLAIVELIAICVCIAICV